MSSAVTRWTLGIDLGTSYTVAAAAIGGDTDVIDIESSGSTRIPSSVYLSVDNELLVGTAALHQAVFAPDRFEPTPKRLIGEGSVFLGDRLVSIAELMAAILRRVYTEACRQRGERPPSKVVVTHPAGWTEVRLRVLREALALAGINDTELLAEPVAAAVRIAFTSTSPGQRIAVYDYGGGTFDAAVLARTSDGFKVVGPPAGRDPLGGEDIDQRILTYLGELLEPDFPNEWQSLSNPPDIAWRRNAASLRREIQRAKETLSDTGAVQLWVSGVECDVQLTRAELDRLVVSDVEATVATLQIALADASISAAELANLYLVGGSSRMPIVADTIWRRLGVRPSVQDNPKSVVALGAALYAAKSSEHLEGISPTPVNRWAVPEGVIPTPVSVPTVTGPPPSFVSGGATTSTPTTSPATGLPSVGSSAQVTKPTAAAPATAPLATSSVTNTVSSAPASVSVGRSFQSRLRLDIDPMGSPNGYECLASLVLDRAGTDPLTIRARDENSAFADSAALGSAALQNRMARTPGFQNRGGAPADVLGSGQGLERRFAMTTDLGVVEMFELYLVTGGRAYVVAGPMAARDLGTKLTVLPVSASAMPVFESRFAVHLPPSWAAHEQVSLRRSGTNHALTADRWSPRTPLDPTEWTTRKVGALVRGSGTTLVGQSPAKVLGCDGTVATISWSSQGVAMLTKLGTAVLDDEAVAMVLSLPHSEQAVFPSLARHAMPLLDRP